MGKSQAQLRHATMQWNPKNPEISSKVLKFIANHIEDLQIETGDGDWILPAKALASALVCEEGVKSSSASKHAISSLLRTFEKVGDRSGARLKLVHTKCDSVKAAPNFGIEFDDAGRLLLKSSAASIALKLDSMGFA
jgi:hypothetical protein